MMNTLYPSNFFFQICQYCPEANPMDFEAINLDSCLGSPTFWWSDCAKLCNSSEPLFSDLGNGHTAHLMAFCDV